METTTVDIDYDGYLRLASLLGQQVPRSRPPVHDELMFIVAHQAYELWFKVLLHELEAVRDGLLDGRLRLARHLLRRSGTVQQVLLAQLDVLETMDPQEFLAFRAELGAASGLQSVQFAEIEILSGAKDGQALRNRRLTATVRSTLEQRLAQPSVWEAYVGVLPGRDIEPTGPDVGACLLRRLCLVAQDRDRYAEAWELAQSLLTYDRLAAQWRFRHVQLVERTIGRRRGSGGTSGVGYLRRQTDLRFYPLLWELPALL